jgi:hypothetical protein
MALIKKKKLADEVIDEIKRVNSRKETGFRIKTNSRPSSASAGHPSVRLSTPLVFLGFSSNTRVMAPS